MQVDKDSSEKQLLFQSQILKLIYGFVFGFGGAIFIFIEFAFSTDANSIVVAYFCIISLTGWLNIGLPIDKVFAAKDLMA